MFRIVEENSSFSFEHIKTIITKHDFLTTHNPTWEYDSSRNMIWGHCLTEDWRWCEYVSFPFRSFSMPGGMFFKAFGASYVCVVSRDKASFDTKVTITIGNETRVINVKKGESISEVFRYVENEGGCCFIFCNQENESFRQKFDVYTCDNNGNTMTLLVMRVAVVGFEAPDLSDSTTIVINNGDFTQPVYIDEGIVQGGACYNGKLFIPFHNYQDINGRPSDSLSPICLIVDPTTGIVDRFIRLLSEREPEGCAIYDGNLYISHHIGNATNDTTNPSFELYKYSLK